jgi:long-chain acyl-CoA synthetase
MLRFGVAVGYGNARSLTDASVRNCKGDLTELRPTLMAGVPTIYDRVRKGGVEKIEKSGALVKFLFDFGFKQKKAALAQYMDTPFWNALVFNKFKSQLGGRMRIMLSGGAPLSKETHEFLRVCFSCNVIQGYGLTETCGGGTLMHYQDHSLGRVGPPVPGAEIKLVDVAEMGYKSSDFPYPRGEVWIRGANVAIQGYFKQPKKTEEDFRKGGWFATGDVGLWHPDGTLEIIDRVKNLVKLSHGEYVALESIESKFKNSAFVDNICVYADSKEAFVVALVAPNKPKLTEWAEKNNIPHADDFEELCKNPAANKEVLNSILTAGRQAKLKAFELPRAIYLCHDEWTPQSGMLTAAMKLKRAPLTAHFKAELKEMYDKNRE